MGANNFLDMSDEHYMIFNGAEETKELAIETVKKLKEIFPNEKFRIEPSSALFNEGHYQRTGGKERWNISSQIFFYGNDKSKPILAERGIII